MGKSLLNAELGGHLFVSGFFGEHSAEILIFDRVIND
jgi:hypothetical protein